MSHLKRGGKTVTHRIEGAIERILYEDKVVGKLIELPKYRFVSLDLVSDVAREAIREYSNLLTEGGRGC